jgi:polysaccharide biosynthesis protein PslH
MSDILVIIPYHVFPPTTGGEKSIYTFTTKLSERHTVVAVSTNLNTNPENAAFELLNFFGPTRWRYFNVFDVIRMYRLCKQRNIKYILADHPYYGWQAWVLKKWLGIPCFVRSHNIEYQRFKSIGSVVWRMLYLYERWVYRFADILFCISDEDRDFAIKEFNIAPDRCKTLTYGIPYRDQPATFPEERATICKEQNIPDGIPILLFNGAMDHRANQQALEIILYKLNPELKKVISDYRIVVCGRKLPDYYLNLPAELWDKVIYTGFVKDIDLYIKGADIQINPIISGGGIKTKVIEALGYSKMVVSFKTGAIGVRQKVCDDKLLVCDDEDCSTFAKLVKEGLQKTPAPISQAFYDNYYLDSIIKNMDPYFKS